MRLQTVRQTCHHQCRLNTSTANDVISSFARRRRSGIALAANISHSSVFIQERSFFYMRVALYPRR